MKRLFISIFLLFSLSNITFAQNDPIIIATAMFIPPHTMMSGGNHVFGFDVSMMRTLCEEMGKKCEFKPMPFRNVIPSVAKGEADLGIGAITITPQRAEMVNFSDPYLPSYAHFMISQKTEKKYGENLNFKTLTFGILKGSIFLQVALDMGISQSKMIIYDNQSDIISALYNEKVDITILDNPTVHFWITQNAFLLKYGNRFSLGYGLGIAVNPADSELLKQINNALKQYRSSTIFLRQYNTYLGPSFYDI